MEKIVMSDHARRKELQAHYKQTRRPAGVYRIVNRKTQRAFLASTPNLDNVRSKMAFAVSTGMAGVFDRRLRADIEQCGIDAFSLEVLEELDIAPGATDAEIRADLTALEELWREKQDPALLY
jgi:hypothetical protein